MDIRISPKACLFFVLFLCCFGVLVFLDQGTGVVSHIWVPLIWGLIALASLAIYVRIWRARRNFDDVKKIEAQGLYGIMPPRLRNWLFP
jgi:hypothetical protein